jgi:hypothetical protein
VPLDDSVSTKPTAKVRYMLREDDRNHLWIHREVHDEYLRIWTYESKVGPFKDKAAARQHMIDTTDERKARDA